MAEIEPQLRCYFNPVSDRHYILELVKDLLGAWVVTKYYGKQRQVIAHPDAQSAFDYFESEDRRRLERHYKRVD